MKLAPMSESMRELVSEAIRFQSAKGIKLTRDYLDQGAVIFGDFRWMTGCAVYTPWGIACVEAAFLDRMDHSHDWDGKTLIRKDILTCPHLHPRIKRRLLRAHEKADWARWHDGFFARRILALKPGGLRRPLEEQIRRCRHLTRASRANLLMNLYPLRSGLEGGSHAEA
jgi:hypothetical protein